MMQTKITHTLEKLAAFSDSQLIGDGQYCVSGINTLLKAGKDELSFLSNSRYQSHLSVTQAGCVVIAESEQHLFSGNKIVAQNPYYVYALISQLFAPSAITEGEVHSSVVFGSHCQVASDVDIGANVVLGCNVAVAKGVKIGAGCYIGDHTSIGENTTIYPNVSIYGDTTIGCNSIIHSGVVIGADGFGFAAKKDGVGGWQKVYQLGGVDIGDDVEIGAGTTIDRGALDNTTIANGVKIDNQIQIAHNVHIGENTAIAACTAIAGSTNIGKRCTIAGAVGIVGHLTIVDDVHITAMTMVSKSINKAGSYSSGTPMNETAVWRKNAARFNHLDSIIRKQ